MPVMELEMPVMPVMPVETEIPDNEFAVPFGFPNFNVPNFDFPNFNVPNRELSVAGVLEFAADLLARPGGWVRFALWNPERTAFCALGAIMAGSGNLTLLNPNAQKAIMAVLGASDLLEGLISIIPTALICTWNNLVVRDQEEIVRVFRQAAAAERLKECQV